jgi:hypothetical protein
VIFEVREKVSHPLIDRVYIRVRKIVGQDLPHAVTMISAPESVRTDLIRKNKATHTDSDGRRLEIEIIGEMKA